MERKNLTLLVVVSAARKTETERLDAIHGPRCEICKRRPFESCERDGCPRG